MTASTTSTASASSPELGRRSFVATLASFAALVAAAMVIAAVAQHRERSRTQAEAQADPADVAIDPSDQHPPKPDPEVLTFLGPLATGAPLSGTRWRILAIAPLQAGRLPLELADPSGPRIPVEVLRRSDDAPPGIAQTPTLAIYLRNNGDGQSPTDPRAEQAAKALATALTQREQLTPPPSLATMHQRPSDPP